jgi:hypothetical protein
VCYFFVGDAANHIDKHLLQSKRHTSQSINQSTLCTHTTSRTCLSARPSQTPTDEWCPSADLWRDCRAFRPALARARYRHWWRPVTSNIITTAAATTTNSNEKRAYRQATPKALFRHRQQCFGAVKVACAPSVAGILGHIGHDL